VGRTRHFTDNYRDNYNGSYRDNYNDNYNGSYRNNYNDRTRQTQELTQFNKSALLHGMQHKKQEEYPGHYDVNMVPWTLRREHGAMGVKLG